MKQANIFIIEIDEQRFSVLFLLLVCQRFSVVEAKDFQFDLNPSCDDEAVVEWGPAFLQSLMRRDKTSCKSS